MGGACPVNLHSSLRKPSIHFWRTGSSYLLNLSPRTNRNSLPSEKSFSPANSTLRSFSGPPFKPHSGKEPRGSPNLHQYPPIPRNRLCLVLMIVRSARPGRHFRRYRSDTFGSYSIKHPLRTPKLEGNDVSLRCSRSS